VVEMKDSNLWYPQITGWVSYFDIAGFKTEIENNIYDVQLKLNNLLPMLDNELKKINSGKDDEFKIYYTYYQDTFIFYSRTKDNERISAFTSISQLSVKFYGECLNKNIILRGAISYGNITLSKCHRFFLGEAVSEAYSTCESKNKKLFSLTLTKSAVNQVEKMSPDIKKDQKRIGNFYNLSKFASLKKFIEDDKHTYLYNFCGSAISDISFKGTDKYFSTSINVNFEHNRKKIEEEIMGGLTDKDTLENYDEDKIKNLPNSLQESLKVKQRYETTLKFISEAKKVEF
jgi:hypothetical protein